MLVLMFIVVLVLLLLLVRAIAGKQLRYMILDRSGAAICRLRGRHQRSRKRVKKIGDTFQSRCRICDIALEKKGRDDAWLAKPPVIPGPRPWATDPDADLPDGKASDFWDEDEAEPA